MKSMTTMAMLRRSAWGMSGAAFFHIPIKEQDDRGFSSCPSDRSAARLGADRHAARIAAANAFYRAQRRCVP
jgi:hypothetical protein